MTDIVKILALSREHEDEKAHELWPYLYAALDESLLHPEEQEHATNWKKNSISYDTQNGHKSITGGQFANIVSGHRKTKK